MAVRKSGGAPLLRLLGVTVVPLLFFVSLVAWSVSSPPSSSPDEDFHLASIWCAASDGGDLCEAGPTSDTRYVSQTLVNGHTCFAYQASQSAACANAVSAELVESDRGNFHDGSYPPVFYAVMSIFTSDDVDQSVMTMRIFNSALFVGLLSLLWFMAPKKVSKPLLLAPAVAMVPLGVFLIASVNPSGWSITGALVLWGASTAFFAETNIRRLALFGGLSLVGVVMAAGSRGDSGLYAIVIVVLSYALSMRWVKSSWRPVFNKNAFRSIDLVLVGLVVLIGAAFFLTSGQSAIVQGTPVESTEHSTVQLLIKNVTDLPALILGVFGNAPMGGLGWLDTPLPSFVALGTTAVFAGVCFWAMRWGGARRFVLRGAALLALVVVPLYVLTSQSLAVGAGVQPRYMFALLLTLLLVLFATVPASKLSFSRGQWVAIAGVLSAAHTLALHANIRRYVTGADVQGMNLNADVEWWSGVASPNTVAALGALSFAVAITLTLSLFDRKRAHA